MNARDEMLHEYGLADSAPLGTLGELRSKLKAYRAEVLAEEAATPLVVRRVDCSVEPALEDEHPELLVCCVAEDGRPVALLLDDEARAKLAGLLGLAGKGTDTGEPTPAVDFFQVGTAYRSAAGVFQCHAVSHHPQTGERRALGWLFRPIKGVHQWVPEQLDPDDYAVGGWHETGGKR
ncbi:hypothetical protein [Streptomyces lavendulae]|uniref:hypothetical protein n=1 Tax=Streptomyces lavendulae TaxID=1914 RepID=UPI0033E88900